MHTLTWTTHVNYMKYIPLYGQPCKLYEIHTFDNPANMDNPVNYMKYIPLCGQPCKLYEIHNLIWATL